MTSTRKYNKLRPTEARAIADTLHARMQGSTATFDDIRKSNQASIVLSPKQDTAPIRPPGFETPEHVPNGYEGESYNVFVPYLVIHSNR